MGTAQNLGFSFWRGFFGFGMMRFGLECFLFLVSCFPTLKTFYPFLCIFISVRGPRDQDCPCISLQLFFSFRRLSSHLPFPEIGNCFGLLVRNAASSVCISFIGGMVSQDKTIDPRASSLIYRALLNFRALEKEGLGGR